MPDYFFDLPAWFVFSGFAVGVVIFLAGNARVNRRIQLAGAGVVLLAVVLAAVSYFVDTPVEKCVRRTHDIVAATVGQDWPRLESLLDRNTQAVGVRGNKDIVEMARTRVAEFAIESATLTGTKTTRGVSTIDVAIAVFSQQKGNAPPSMQTSWNFEYEQRADGILLARFYPTAVGGSSVKEQIERLMRK